jgi:tetratricopeptide (TPR) repeat protein
MLARLANLAELKGDLQEALRLMERAVQEAVGMAGSREGVAWYLFRLGDLYFNAGQYDQAARHYEAALRVFDNYYLALAGLGKVRAAQGRDDEAIELYERSVAMMPQPSALAALGDLYMETGQQEKARLQFDTVELIATLAAINRQVYNRELALFYADHDVKLDKALELAEREMEVRQDIYGYDALAWTLYKNGRTDEAAKAMREALKLGTQDARLFFHAGMIAKALDDDAAARDYLTRALKLNPQFSVLNADQARLALSEVLRAMTSRAGMGGKDKS